MTRNPASPARRRVLALAGGAALLSPLALRPAFAAEYITIATGGTRYSATEARLTSTCRNT